MQPTRAVHFGIVLVIATAFVTVGIPQAEEYTLRGDAVTVYNLAGEITLAAARGSAVTVEVARGGADGGELRIEQGRIGGQETLRIVYPADAIRYDRSGGTTELRVRDDGTFGHGNREGRRVRVSNRSGDLEAWADLRIGIPAGQTFTLYLAAGLVTATNVDGTLRFDTGSAPVRVDGVRGTVSVDVGSGNVSVVDAEADVRIDAGSGSVSVAGVTGDLSVDTGSGDVEVADVHGTAVRLDVGSGDIRVRDADVAELTIDTGSGNAVVRGTSADDVTVDTGSGNVEISFVDDAEDVAIDTGSGSVTLHVPEAFGAQVDLETSSGDIDLDFPLQVVRAGRDRIRGGLGDGQGRLVIDTGSGNIRLLRVP